MPFAATRTANSHGNTAGDFSDLTSYPVFHPIVFIVMIMGLSSANGDELTPLDRYYDVLFASVVVNTCHLDVAGKVSKDKLKNMHNSAAMQILGDLNNKGSPTNSQDNERLANFIFKKTTELEISNYKRLVDQIGCAALADWARKVASLVVE